MKNAELNQRRQDATPRGVGVMCGFYAERAENATLWDVEGKEVIDFASGIAVLNTGHRHPKVIAAIEKQLQAFTHTAYQIVPYESYVSLAERINQRAPLAGPCKTAFFTTGAEAVENAVKIARAYTGRPGLITFGGGFHGRTYMTMALTGKVAPYKLGFGPFPGSVFHGQYPNALYGVTTEDAMNSLDRLFKADIDPKQVAAIVLEPVQGEGGFNVAPADFMQALRALCDQHGILLIADEVQTGFARTGKLFAMEQMGVAADITTFAKSIAGGFPLAGVTGRAEVMDAIAPGGLGGTYAGNPIACAAALAVLQIFEQENLLEKANQLGDTLRQGLLAIAEDHPEIGDVRGLGAMIAIELFEEGDRSRPNARLTADIVARARDKGLILLSCGPYYNVLRILVPLTIEEAQIEQGLKIIADCFTEAKQA